MQLSLRVVSKNPKHTTFTVFQDGGNCGDLVMDTDAFKVFVEQLKLTSIDLTIYPGD